MDDNRTGYGNPPRSHQFKPGQSGNPNGRPKKEKTMKAIIEDTLLRQKPYKVDGKVENHALLELIVKKTASMAANGNTKAAHDLMHIMTKMKLHEEMDHDESDEDDFDEEED